MAAVGAWLVPLSFLIVWELSGSLNAASMAAFCVLCGWYSYCNCINLVVIIHTIIIIHDTQILLLCLFIHLAVGYLVTGTLDLQRLLPHCLMLRARDTTRT